jgi:hypothetical protein
MLFDSQADRSQRHNIANKNWAKVEQMDASLRAWLADLQEPLSSQKEDYQTLLKPVEYP